MVRCLLGGREDAEAVFRGEDPHWLLLQWASDQRQGQDIPSAVIVAVQDF